MAQRQRIGVTYGLYLAVVLLALAIAQAVFLGVTLARLVVLALAACNLCVFVALRRAARSRRGRP